VQAESTLHPQLPLVWTGLRSDDAPDLHGCPRGKSSYACHFKGKHGKLYIVGKPNKCRFRKKYKLPVSSISQKKITSNPENDHVSFNWINRVSNPSAWQNNCTVLITKDQSSRVSQHFSIIWLVIFLINLPSSSSKEYSMGIALMIVTGEILQISKIPDTLLFHNF